MKEDDILRQDDELRELFADFQPQLSDDHQFMQTLQHRMDALDYVAQLQQAQVKRYRRNAAISLVVGILSGAVVTGGYLLLWQPSPMLSISLQANLLRVFQDNLPFFSLVALTLLLAGTIISLSSSIMGTLPLPSLQGREKK